MEPTETAAPDPGSIAGVAARLVLWGRRAPQGLARVEFDSDFSRRQVDERVRAACAAASVPFYPVSLPQSMPAALVVTWLKEQFAPLPRGVVSITGWATAFPPDVPLIDSLRVLNYNRENLAQFPLCQIWWLTRPLADAFLREIPDLNSWFLVRLSLTENIAAPADAARRDQPTLATPETQEAARSHAARRADRFRGALAAGAPLPELAALADAASDPLRDIGLRDETQALSGELLDAITSAEAYRAFQSGAVSLKETEKARLFHHLAALLADRGSVEDAVSAWETALAATEKVVGPEDAQVAAILNNLGVLYLTEGRYSEAEPFFVRALAIRERELGPNHPDTGTVLNNLGLLYGDQGRYAKAISLLARALAITERFWGPDYPDVASLLSDMALLYTEQGHPLQAEPLLERALAVTERAFGPEHLETASALAALASLYAGLGKNVQAESLYRRAARIQKARLGPDHPQTLSTMGNRAEMLRRLGREGQAKRIIRQV